MPDGVAVMSGGVAAMRDGMALAASGVPTCCCGAPPPCGCIAAAGCDANPGTTLYYETISAPFTSPVRVWERQAVNCCCNLTAGFTRTIRIEVVVRYVAGGNNCEYYRYLYEGTDNAATGGSVRIREWTTPPFNFCNGYALTSDQTVPHDFGCAPPFQIQAPFAPFAPNIEYGYRRVTCSEVRAQYVSSDNPGNRAFLAVSSIDIQYGDNQAGCVHPTCVNCCLPGPSCIKTSKENCLLSGGAVVVDCGVCLTRQRGACCLPNGTCTFTSQTQCEQVFGVFLGPGIPCKGLNCPQPPTGACCLPDGTCTVTTNQACISAGGAYQGNNVSCATVNCAPVEGACCYPEGGCIITTGRTPCESTGGTYFGDGTNCAGNPCGVGACCLPSGVCQEYTAQGCSQNAGTFLGVGVPCDINAVCVGCCCRSPTILSVVTSPAECLQLGGTYYGNGTTCQIVVEPGDTTTGAVIDCDNPPPQPRAVQRRVLAGSEAFI